ncbi:MAG TPA: 3-oxoadipyl-CoA thiolase, partial [Spongiibacteraceae bacterium]|nr:3-oxoadipyl-CoA thiolase [Spongiibacteraceae bacterium]
MYDAYIYAGARTPFGRYGGALASVRPDDLLAKVLQEVLHSCPKAGAFVEDIVIGAANQAGEDCRNIARMAGLLAGIPIDVAGQTVNRLCGSSLSAVMDVARAIHCGDGRLYIAGGVESMSRAPFVIGKAESAYSRSANIFDSSIGERFPNPALTAMVGSDSMPETADNVAAAFDISREDCDRFSLASQTKYRLASEAGFYESEIVAVELPSRRKQPALQVSRDEHPRSDTTYEALQALKPLFSGGVVTAGNASGINDGAVALLLGTREVGSTIGLRPRGRVIAGAVAGVEP